MLFKTFTVIKHADKHLKVKCLLSKQSNSRALIILSEIWGLNQHIQEVAEQYNALGFDVYLPDIYWRIQENTNLNYDSKDTETARELYSQLNISQASKDIDLVIDYIIELNSKYKIGILGFCMGGTLTYQLRSTNIKAIVAYYGSQISNLEPFIKNIEKPILFHLAENDHLITQDEIRNLEVISNLKPNFLIYRYPLTGHGFNCPYRSNFSNKAAILAFERSKLFFTQNLVKND